VTDAPVAAGGGDAAGRSAVQTPEAPAPPADTTRRGALGLTPRGAAALAWVGGWISGAVVLWLEPTDRFVRSHAAYALTLVGGLMAAALGTWGLGLLMAFVTPWLFRTLTWLSAVLWVLLAVAWIAGLVQAVRGKLLRVPAVDAAVARITSRRSTLPAPPPPL
jgi:uncharacterized membrane protein